MNLNLRMFIWKTYMSAFIFKLKKPYYLYGAGQHTKSILMLAAQEKLRYPVKIIDDNPPYDSIDFVQCLKISDIEFPEEPSCIILSSDIRKTRGKMFGALKKNKLPSNVEIIDPYSYLPDGPYVKL